MMGYFLQDFFSLCNGARAFVRAHRYAQGLIRRELKSLGIFLDNLDDTSRVGLMGVRKQQHQSTRYKHAVTR